MTHGKKYLAEFLGTACLVLFGCGTAAFLPEIGIVGVALAFGLSIVAMAYCIGNISGCHINPAVSFGMLLTKRMDGKDFVGYVIAQLLGALAGAGLLALVLSMSNAPKDVVGLGANGFAANSAVQLSVGGAILAEILLTFFFVWVILAVTADEKKSSVAGLVIALTLTLVHLLGIRLTGTSVNPARSLAPALLLGGEALSQVWVFLVAPMLGAALAAVAYRLVNSEG